MQRAKKTKKTLKNPAQSLPDVCLRTSHAGDDLIWRETAKWPCVWWGRSSR